MASPAERAFALHDDSAAQPPVPAVLKTLVGYAVRRAQLRVYADFNATLEAEGITPTRFSALVAISEQQGLKQNDLANLLGIAPSGVFKLIDALDVLGLIERRPVEGDKRAYSLWLTKEGVKKLERYVDLVAEHDDRLCNKLTPPERHALIELLNKLGT